MSSSDSLVPLELGNSYLSLAHRADHLSVGGSILVRFRQGCKT